MQRATSARGRTVTWTLAALALELTARCALVLDFALVGDVGNAADTGGKGGVSYGFAIGLYEVTNDQYAAFLNAVAASDPNGLYDSAMGSFARGGITRSGSDGSYVYSVKANMGDKPVVYVNYFDTLRFANWLQNGQPTGPQSASTTEDGAYTMYGPTSTTGRNPGALYWLPTEDEWYKAAYYQPVAAGGDTDSYWKYATGSNATPTFAFANASGVVVNPGPNVANTDSAADWNSQNGNVTSVGTAGARSYYGAYDMAGNVWEITETFSIGTSHVMLGGSWFNSAAFTAAGFGTSINDDAHFDHIGFRIATVPEPNGTVGFCAGLMLIGLYRFARHGSSARRSAPQLSFCP